jgi:hypothetical protein
MALYRLVAGETEAAEASYEKTLSSRPSRHRIRVAIEDLDDLLNTFPEHAGAREIRELLQRGLEKAPEPA